MKHFLISLLFLFSTAILFSQNLEDLDFGTDTTLEIMTWNMEWFPKEGQTTVDYVSAIIEALEVDVIAVQEIDDYQAFVNMMETLEGWEGFATNSGYLNLGYIYNPEFVQMVSIYQILPGASRELPRKPLVMEFIFNESKYVLINNHLKCCGDGVMNTGDPWDEETRRRDACVLIDTYIDDNFADENVILLGDLNDLLTDEEANNVFQVFFDDSANYLFSDLAIAEGNSADWSYPTWPSHLDHLLITSELFDEFDAASSVVATLRIDDYLDNGWWEYEEYVSDHRPVAFKFVPQAGSAAIDNPSKTTNLKVYPNPVKTLANISFDPAGENSLLEIFDMHGQKVKTIDLNKGQSIYSWEIKNGKPGIYSIRLKSDGQPAITQKIIIAGE